MAPTRELVVQIKGECDKFGGSSKIKNTCIYGGVPKQHQRAELKAGAEIAIEIHEFPMPVVVASTGHALAMGAILLMAADTRIGADGTYKIGLNEVAIGMPVPKFAVELARTSLSNAAFTSAVNHATVYDPAGAVTAGYLDQVVAADAVISTALAHAAELAERLDPNAFALTRANCRGASLELIRNGLNNDIASFVVKVPDA
jgi:enoyl-CoA hydratase